MGDCFNAVVLAGGRGRRLRPFTTVLPKPLVPVGDVPILEIVLHQLRERGFRRIVLAVNHLEGLIRSYFGDGRSFGIEILYSKEDRPLGTIGPLQLVADRLDEHFLMLNGDLLTDLPFDRLLAEHGSAPRTLTVATCVRRVRLADGVIETDAAGRITAFREKPAMEFAISGGVYAMSRSVLDLIPRDRPFGMDDLILTMLERGLDVHSYRHGGAWYDIGCTGDLKKANRAFAKERTRFLAADERTIPATVREAEPSARDLVVEQATS